VANNQLVATDEDEAINIIMTASDVDGDLLSYSIVAGPSHGTLSGTPPQVTYTLLSVTTVLTVLLSRLMMAGWIRM